VRRFGSATHGKAGGSLVALWISIEAGQARDRDLTLGDSEPRRLAAGLFVIHVRSFCRL